MSFRVFFLSLFLFVPLSFGQGRFYYEGDGCLSMKSTHGKPAFKGYYRKADGTYDESVLKKLDVFFAIPKSLNEHFSLRTLAFLDFLQDKFAPNQTITITSAYRTPAHNKNLRAKGGLVGKTSYHLEGMAVDVIFPGVKTEEVWTYARTLNYGGIGYYRGSNRSVHIDSGKPRSWTPDNAIDPDNIPALNKNLFVSVDRDIYHPAETMDLFFSGISNYPFGLKSNFELYNGDTKLSDLSPNIEGKNQNGCVAMLGREQVRKISWKIPEEFANKNKKLHFKIKFCEPIYFDSKYDSQPSEINSREFEIQ